MKNQLKSLGLLGAGCLSAVPLFASWPTDAITLSITTASPAYVIPSTFVGVAFSNAYISGDNSAEALFDSTQNTYYSHLQNLIGQIGIKHIRTLHGTALTRIPGSGTGTSDR